LKVAFVNHPFQAPSFLDIGDSVNIVTWEIATRLAKQCEVIVYSKKQPNQEDSEFLKGVLHHRISANEDDKVNYFTSGIDKRLPRAWLNKLRHPLYASNFSNFMYGLRVAKQLKSQKCDIVHIQNFSQFVHIIKAINPRIKIVLHMHCEWLAQLDRTMIKHRLSKTDLVISVSRYITEKTQHIFPQFAERCQTLYNGVDVNSFTIDPPKKMSKINDDKHLLFVGRVSPEKGVHILLQAFARVIKRYPHTHLTIVGAQGVLPFEFLVGLSDDSKTSKLASFYKMNYMAYLLQISSGIGRTTFVGPVPHRSIIDYFRNADVVVLPSVCNEAFGMPLVEAMATGTPVVATNSGGFPEIVSDGQTGLIVERADAPALSEAILTLLSDKDLRDSMGKAAQKRVIKNFSWEKTTENLLQLYQKHLMH
jgi:spore coat protein SA